MQTEQQNFFGEKKFFKKKNYEQEVEIKNFSSLQQKNFFEVSGIISKYKLKNSRGFRQSKKWPKIQTCENHMGTHVGAQPPPFCCHSAVFSDSDDARHNFKNKKFLLHLKKLSKKIYGTIK